MTVVRRSSDKLLDHYHALTSIGRTDLDYRPAIAARNSTRGYHRTGEVSLPSAPSDRPIMPDGEQGPRCRGPVEDRATLRFATTGTARQ